MKLEELGIPLPALVGGIAFLAVLCVGICFLVIRLVRGGSDSHAAGTGGGDGGGGGGFVFGRRSDADVVREGGSQTKIDHGDL